MAWRGPGACAAAIFLLTLAPAAAIPALLPAWEYDADGAVVRTTAVSPDGRRLVALTDRGVYVFDTASRVPAWIADVHGEGVGFLDNATFVVHAGRTVAAYSVLSSAPLWTYAAGRECPPPGGSGIDQSNWVIDASARRLAWLGACDIHYIFRTSFFVEVLQADGTLAWRDSESYYEGYPYERWRMNLERIARFAPQGHLAFTSGDAVDLRDPAGARVWRYATGTQVTALALAADASSFVASTGVKLYHFTRPLQAPQWTRPVEVPGGLEMSPDGSTVYVADGTTLTALRADGTEAWRRAMDAPIRGLELSASRLRVGADRGDAWVDPDTGEAQWRLPSDEAADLARDAEAGAHATGGFIRFSRAADLPDLRATAIDLDASASRTLERNVSVTVRNDGNVSVRGIAVRIHVDGLLAASATLASLAPRAEGTAVLRVALAPGEREVRAVVDPQDEIMERDEANNALALPFRVPDTPAPVPGPTPTTRVAPTPPLTAATPAMPSPVVTPSPTAGPPIVPTRTPTLPPEPPAGPFGLPGTVTETIYFVSAVTSLLGISILGAVQMLRRRGRQP